MKPKRGEEVFFCLPDGSGKSVPAKITGVHAGLAVLTFRHPDAKGEVTIEGVSFCEHPAPGYWHRAVEKGEAAPGEARGEQVSDG